MSAPPFGAFARIWPHGRASEIAAAMRSAGLTCAQWNFSAVGRQTVSADLTEEDYQAVADAFAAESLPIWGLSVTHNNTHPDPDRREQLQAAAVSMIRLAPLLGVTAVTISAGSCHESGWEAHPDNATPRAWNEMRTGLDRLLTAAADAGVAIGIEPEAGSIVSDTAAARRLLDEVGPGSSAAIILDAWNLAAGDRTRSSREVVDEAFQVLGADSVGLQAKDPYNATFPEPTVDYEQVAALQAQYCPGTSVVIQDVAADSMAVTVARLKTAWAAR